jgi:hypothetical protein
LGLQALILQIQVKAQADKDVASYEAEWAQLTNIVEQDRRSREAQRQRDIAVREGQMAELFSLECTPASKRRAAAPGRAPPTGEVAAAATAAAAVVDSTGAAASAPERIRELKAALSKVLEATGERALGEMRALRGTQLAHTIPQPAAHEAGGGLCLVRPCPSPVSQHMH